jgi:hypothetical protein
VWRVEYSTPISYTIYVPPKFASTKLYLNLLISFKILDLVVRIVTTRSLVHVCRYTSVSEEYTEIGCVYVVCWMCVVDSHPVRGSEAVYSY